MMTDTDIARHDQTLADLTAADGIPRLTWDQHGATFRLPVPHTLDAGTLVASVDSATPGKVVGFSVSDGKYDVTFPDVGGICRYSPRELRPWPLASGARPMTRPGGRCEIPEE